MTILTIAQTCAQRLQIASPSSFYGTTDNNMLLLNAMILRTINEIKDDYLWPELQKEYTFTTIANQPSYRLPADFDRFVMESLWNRAQRWPLIGPTDAGEWQIYKSGIVTSMPRQRYRIKGWSDQQFFLDPTPSTNETIVFEYVSSSTIKPKAWVLNTAYALNVYVSNNGLILKCTSNGTSNNGVQSPEFGRDGTCFWSNVPVYVASADYYIGQYVFANSNVYQCTVAGKGSATAPSHSSGSVVNGTCTFLFISTPAAWVAGTAYTTLTSFVYNSTDCYQCIQTGISGLNAPKFRSVLTATGVPGATTTDTITDGTVIWTVQTAAYDTFTADTDNVILDNQIITDGAVWRFKQERGFNFEDLRKQAFEQLETSKTRLQNTDVLSMRGGGTNDPMPLSVLNYPIGSFGL